MTDRGYANFCFGEVRAHATATSPKGILGAIVSALNWHGIDPEKIADIDMEALATQFDKIDATQFRKLLSACEFAGLQIVVIETTERVGRGVVSTRDPGTRLGMIS